MCQVVDFNSIWPYVCSASIFYAGYSALIRKLENGKFLLSKIKKCSKIIHLPDIKFFNFKFKDPFDGFTKSKEKSLEKKLEEKNRKEYIEYLNRQLQEKNKV